MASSSLQYLGWTHYQRLCRVNAASTELPGLVNEPAVQKRGSPHRFPTTKQLINCNGKATVRATSLCGSRLSSQHVPYIGSSTKHRCHVSCVLEIAEAARSPALTPNQKSSTEYHHLLLDRTSSMVNPVLPTETCWIPLSHLDILTPDHDILACFAYAPQQPSQPIQSLIRTLKTSLAEALVSYYPLAGRLVMSKKDGPSLHCNDAGVEFEEAETDARFEDVDCFQPKCFDQFAPRKRLSVTSDRSVHDEEELIPFSVKVTVFRCGGVILGCRFHHRVVDTSAATHFLIAWSKIARGMAVSSIQPFHHRQLLIKPRSPVQPRRAEQLQYTEVPMPPPSDRDPNVEVRSYYMSREMIENLKRETREDAYTSVTAFFWRASMRARHVDLQKTAHVYVVVNCRRALGVPFELFGNVLGYGVAESDVTDLVREPLGRAAGRVREALGHVDRESLQSVIDMAEMRRQRLLEEQCIVMPALGREHQDSMLSSSMVSFPLYKVNFGWGTPCFVTINPSKRYHGFMYFVPPPPTLGGGLLANVECLCGEGLDIDHELEALESSRSHARSLASMLT